METLIIPEQDIISAVCVYISRKEQIAPEEVEVELMYDDDNGFTGESFTNGKKRELKTLNIIEALRLWLKEFLNRDPLAGIRLELDEEEGIIAIVRNS